MPNFDSRFLLSKIPNDWASILGAVQATFGKECVIHGGSMRDLSLGRDPSDIDIAVPYNPDKDQQLPFFIPHTWEIVKITTKHQTDHYKDGVPQISGNIFNIKVRGVQPQVQLIPYNFPRNWFGRHVINNNDFGMNQIGFDGTKILYNTNFEHDFFNKVFTFRKLGTPYMARNAIRRAEKWEYSGKYEGFRFDCSLAQEFLDRKNP
jgi:hypothetical protein